MVSRRSRRVPAAGRVEAAHVRADASGDMPGPRLLLPGRDDMVWTRCRLLALRASCHVEHGDPVEHIVRPLDAAVPAAAANAVAGTLSG
ncbi:hypothetical protein [Streptomyces decoyicus]|uniref:hypothetical protein n=1 Tax=Streptomyces decoyicus TaxID=249567 RepID=UPI003654D56E